MQLSPCSIKRWMGVCSFFADIPMISWDTPFIDIMRIFSEILLKNEHRETSLAAALKNAIYYPENEDSYLNPLESNGFFRDMNYPVLMISCHTMTVIPVILTWNSWKRRSVISCLKGSYMKKGSI